MASLPHTPMSRVTTRPALRTSHRRFRLQTRAAARVASSPSTSLPPVIVFILFMVMIAFDARRSFSAGGTRPLPRMSGAFESGWNLSRLSIGSWP